MGSQTSVLLQEDDINEISRETGFSNHQISRLYSRFVSLDKSDNGKLSPNDMMRIPELAINPLGSRIVEAFFASCGEETDTINFRQFVQILAIFRPRKKGLEENDINSKEAKLHFAFRIYDLENNGEVSDEELLTVLKMMVGSNITDEQLRSIAKRTILEANENGDGSLTFEHFKKALNNIETNQVMSIRFLH